MTPCVWHHVSNGSSGWFDTFVGYKEESNVKGEGTLFLLTKVSDFFQILQFQSTGDLPLVSWVEFSSNTNLKLTFVKIEKPYLHGSRVTMTYLSNFYFGSQFLRHTFPLVKV